MLRHTRTPGPSLAALAVFAAVAVALAACGGSASPAAPTDEPTSAATAAPSTPAAAPTDEPAQTPAPEGLVDVAEHGFSFVVPDGWQQIPMDAESLQAMIEVLPEDSEMGEFMRTQQGQLAAAGIAVWAMDLRAVDAPFVPNVNIIVQPDPGVTLAQLSIAGAAELGAFDSITVRSNEIVTLPFGDAVRLEYLLRQPDAAGGVVNVAGIQYYAIGSGNVLIISFSCDEDALGSCPADVESIIGTLAFG